MTFTGFIMIYCYGRMSQRVAISYPFVTIKFASFKLMCRDQNEIHYLYSGLFESELHRPTNLLPIAIHKRKNYITYYKYSIL